MGVQPRWTRLWCGVLALSLVIALSGAARSVAQDIPASPILVVDADRLFAESVIGRGVRDELEAERDALVNENNRIEQELIAEERDLTEKRASLPVEEFRKLAEAFDLKVQAIRNAQDGKARALAQKFDQRRAEFVSLAQPYLEAIMAESGAVVMLERRNAVLVAQAIDVTDLAIARIDAGEAPDQPPQENGAQE